MSAIAEPVVFQPQDEEARAHVSVWTTFAFTGFLQAIDEDGVVLPLAFTGRGIAAMTYENEGERVGGRPVFMPLGDGESGPGYEFAPVPEPASLLLVGTGVAGLAARVRRRRD